MRKTGEWLKNLSVTKKILLGFATLIVASAAGGSNHQANLTVQNVSQGSQASLQHATPKPAASVSKQPNITTKVVEESQSIPFNSTTVSSSALAQGTSKVTTAGVNGTETVTYQVTYTDGKQTDKKLINTTVTAAPVTQVTAIGTYVAPPPPPPASSCPNGTYVNSAGNTVCSPYASSTTPAGATAQCADGTYSFSQSRSGTCSHHGGVSQWL